MSGGIDYSKWDNLSVSSNSGNESYGDDGDYEYEDSMGALGLPSVQQQFDQQIMMALNSSHTQNGNNNVAETALLNRGISYEKDTRSTERWLLVGVKKNIMIHPNDNGVPHYSDVIFNENPDTFVPDRSKYEDGRVLKWGLDDPASQDQNDAAAIISSMMSRNNTRELYEKIENPEIQFINLLIARRKKYHRSEEVTARMNGTYILKIELCHCEEDVWRIVHVPSGITLSCFQDQVICPVMGWSRAYHGYVFEDPKDGTIIGPQKHGAYIDTMHVSMHYIKVMDNKGVPLAAILKEKGDVFYYNYDLGDNWMHRIILQDIVAEEDCVTLVAGKGACPPEDSNGLGEKGCMSYANFLKSYKKNPKKLKMKEAVKEASKSINYSKPWSGGPPMPFKPLEFNLAYHRAILKTMILGPAVKTSRGQFAGADKTLIKSFEGCKKCGNRLKPLSKCTGCEQVQYCSRDCQVADWQSHKVQCTKKFSKKENVQRPSSEVKNDKPLKACQKCGDTAKALTVCRGCRKVRYCSRECQKADWQSHKVHCKKHSKR